MEAIEKITEIPVINEQTTDKIETVVENDAVSDETPQMENKTEAIPSVDEMLKDVVDIPNIKEKSKEENEETQSEEPKKEKKETEQKDESYDKKFQTAPELRKELNRLHQLLKQKEDEIKKLSEYSKYEEKIKEYESKLKQYEEIIRTQDYQKSPEFKKQYYEPLEKAWKDALEELSEFTIVDPESGDERKVTAQDLQKIVALPTKEAISKIKEIFGEDYAPIVIAHRKQILDLAKRAQDAVENWKKESERLANEHTQKVERLWKEYNENIIKKYPQFYDSQNEDDKDAIDLHNKGFQLADMALNPPEDLPVEQRIYLLAELRNRAAAFGKIAYKYQKLMDKVKNLEKELSKYKETTPKISKSSTSVNISKIPSVDDDLRAVLGK